MNKNECELLLLLNNQRLDYYQKHINELKDIDFVFFDCLKSKASLF